MIELHKDEKIILTARKHWFVFLNEITSFLIAIIIPFLLAPFYNPIIENSVGLWEETRTIAALVFFVSAWILLSLMMFFVLFTNYYLDTLIITNKRIIDIEQISLFSREIVTAALPKIEDIKIEIKGVIATYLKFGNIHIQTAATSREIIIKGIKYPEKVKRYLVKAYYESGQNIKNPIPLNQNQPQPKLNKE